jgi:hypothetical protein
MTGGSAETHLIVVYFVLILPLKIWLDKHLVFPAPPDDIIKNERTRHRIGCGEGVYRVGMGAVGPGAAL